MPTQCQVAGLEDALSRVTAVFSVKQRSKKWSMYPLVLLGLIALILLAVVAGAVYSVVSRKKAFNAVVAEECGRYTA